MRPSGNVKCYNCLTDWPPEGECCLRPTTVAYTRNSFDRFVVLSVFGEMKTEFTIPFNTYVKRKAAKEEDTDEGPIVERVCPKCGNDRMSYATLQLRSADEGQTVFFTCTNCK